MQNNINTCINNIQFSTWIHCPPHHNLDKVPPQSCSQKRACCATLQVPSPHHLLFWSRPVHSDHLPAQPPSHTLPSHASCTRGTAHPSDSYLKHSNSPLSVKSKTQESILRLLSVKQENVVLQIQTSNTRKSFTLVTETREQPILQTLSKICTKPVIQTHTYNIITTHLQEI